MEQNKDINNKICIYGGTFNPVHNGHINMVLKAKELYSFNKVIILPTGNSYLKTNVLDADIRFEMASIAFKDFDGFEISDFESNNSEPSYTYKTIQEFSHIYSDSELYFLIGEDSLRYIHKWREPEIIFKLAHIVVASRHNDCNEDSIELIKEKLESSYNCEISVFDYNNSISSTYIRNAISSGKGELVKDLVPSDIYNYIINKGLY